MKDSILVIGSEGLVGSRFIELSEHKNKLHTPRFIEFDMTNATEVEAVFKSYDFSAIVNFAAYTDVDGAEKQRGDKNAASWVINVEGIANIAQAVAVNGKKVHLIHISTDMVFPGDSKDKGPYDEKHEPGKDLNRLTWYGYTKAEGERTIRNILGEEASILRIIYPVRSVFNLKTDYLRKPLSLFDQDKLYPLFSDQQVSITFIDEAVQAIDKIISDRKYGNFHASSSNTSTPFELVSYLLEKVRGVKNTVKSQKLEKFIKSANAQAYRYPKYGGLKVEETEKALGMKFRNWKEIIDVLAKQGIGQTTS